MTYRSKPTERNNEEFEGIRIGHRVNRITANYKESLDFPRGAFRNTGYHAIGTLSPPYLIRPE
jgi:hypothetical protein